MSKNLKEKLMLILEDAETLNKYELANRLERFVKEEIDFLQAEHSMSPFDLNDIRSSSISNYNSYDPREFREYGFGSNEHMTTWANVDSVVSWLRNKGLISFTLKYDRKKK